MDSYEEEEGYLKLLKNTLEEGNYKKTRNGMVYSTFGKMIKFNISNFFPLLTTKKVFFRGIVEELLWFISGSTNSKVLENKNINIWKGNSTREYLDSIGLNDYLEGELGPIYGHQWRNYNSQGIDQIKYILKELSNDNNSRRALLSAWNPVQLKNMALPPCHIIYNFYKDSNGLSCLMYLRSSDLFLGLPFNIGSTALLTIIIAKVLNLKPFKICIIITDSHIYDEHVDNVNIQLNREIIELPTLNINKEININCNIDEKIKWIEELKYEDFELKNYMYHSSLKSIMK